MKLLKQAIHTALRDDATATVGVRALTTGAAPSYGVYEAHFPEIPNFKSGLNYVTWQFINAVTTGTPKSDLRLREQLFAVTAWSSQWDSVDDLLARARYVLENLRAVTLPASDAQLIQIQHESSGPDLFDDKFKVNYRAEHFRAWYREDITVAS